MLKLVSAAIRGGLPSETAFSLSDLCCQRADLLGEAPLLENLTFTMLMDFCGRVRERKKQHTDYSLPEITSCLRYPSQSYFTQVFRKYRGQTPRQYRDRK